MPSLPFTFEDVKNWNPADAGDAEHMAKQSKPDMSQSNPLNNAQSFLKKRIGMVKDQFQSADGFIDAGLAINPVTRIVDMGAKFFGMPGIQEGFTKGTTMTGDVRVDPRGPF